MEFVYGAVLALTAGILLTMIGMDRDRSLYPAILIVIALRYILFAVMGGGGIPLAEVAASAVFIGLAVAGFRYTLWIVAAGLAAHGIFDLIIHPNLIYNPGVPRFWPTFCSAYDLAAAAYLGVLLTQAKLAADFEP